LEIIGIAVLMNQPDRLD